MTSDIIIMQFRIPIGQSHLILFHPLKEGRPVEVVMLYISISTAIIVHHVKSYEIALLDGGKQIESGVDRVFLGCEIEEQLLGEDLELNIGSCDFIDDEGLPFGGLFRRASPV